MSETHHVVIVLIGLLLVASGVAMATRWLRVPYTLLLVVVGLVISPMHFLPVVHISPDLILLVFLPALLFEAAWNLKLDHLRANLVPILTLALAGVVVSVGVVAVVLHYAAGLTYPTALLFGAMISATDPVSVLAIFKKLNLPARLSSVVEGESLFNDGTAVVVFRIILGVVLGVVSDSGVAIAFSSVREFVLVVFGGLAIGAAVGVVASTLTSRFEDYLLEITLTTVAAYGSYFAAETIGVSPVISVLVAGLVIGNYGRRIGMSATTQIAVNSFWEYAAFVVNSLVFLLIGLEVQISSLASDGLAIACGIAAMLAGRAVAVYTLMPVVNRFTQPAPWSWQHVLFWGGLRGSLSIALALSLPLTVADRPLLVTMTFGAVLFSLLAQGLTMRPLLRRLGFTSVDRGCEELELLQAALLVETSARAELDSLRDRGGLTDTLYRKLQGSLAAARDELHARLAVLDVENSVLEREQEQRILDHLGDIRRARLAELVREGLVAERTYEHLRRQLDDDMGERKNQSTSEQ